MLELLNHFITGSDASPQNAFLGCRTHRGALVTRLTNRLAAGLVVGLCFASPLLACPEMHKLVDFDCDQTIKMTAVGDSIVYGRGDLKNENHGGWVKRLGRSLDISPLQNLGIPGITTSQLFSKLKKGFHRSGSTLWRKAIDSDVLIVSVGVNDFFEHGDPSLTARNIKRIVAMVREELSRGEHTAPYVLVAKLTPTTRGYQRSFIENVNRLLARYRSAELPSYLRFDLMSEANVSYDGLHPISKGYDQLAAIAANYLKHDATAAMRALRPDADQDGIYDKFENAMFGTSSTHRDSDGDGLNDGKEVFTYHTDPNVADTDADGVNDGDEVALSRDPLTPG